METQLVKWGNSHGIRIPQNILKESEIEPNEMLTLYCRKGQIIVQKKFRHRTLEERAQEYGGSLGPYEEFDWGEPLGREFW